MTTDDLKTGNKINKQKEELQRILDKLEEKESYFKITCGSYNVHIDIPLDITTFNTLKKYVIDDISVQIENLEEQFKQI